eukprot:TRINITY_DN1949_c0_g2_i1.p1 TRINITY_DN1949_c0_g2~~TRINITY_DN1949_c0_g2_i1.p1  ORF type:complete len:507 (+),score=220.85 TRINITY_DN1949_c0_g2_i1:188-1708(+)
MNLFLVVIAILGFILTVGISFYLVVLYSSDDDKNQAWFPKIVVVAGLSFSVLAVLLLPFDVANKRDVTGMDTHTGGINVVVMWEMVLSLIAIWLLIITPFATFYYESWDPTQKNVWNQVRPALYYTVTTDIVFTLFFILFWMTIGYADLSLQSLASPPINWDLEDATPGYQEKPWEATTCICNSNVNKCNTGGALPPPDPKEDVLCKSGTDTLEVRVSAFIYCIGLICVLGWCTFVVFGGAGIIALPMDLINEWRMRPEKISRAEYNKRKEELAQEVEELMKEGLELEEKGESGKREFFGGTKKKINKFGEKVQDLETRQENLDACMDTKRHVLLTFFKLPAGVLGVLMSFLWVLHIILNNLAGVSPFLNNLFVGLDSVFPLFGTLMYTMFAVWMLWAAVKGCFKIGCNFGIISIHPMKLGDTLMSSFMFNTLLVLITSVTVAQFCAMSFRKYAANTVVDTMFSAYVVNLKGIGYVMQYFQIVFLIFSGLTFLYLVVKPYLCCAKN